MQQKERCRIQHPHIYRDRGLSTGETNTAEMELEDPKKTMNDQMNERPNNE